MSIFRRQGEVHETSAAPTAEALAQGHPQDAAKPMPTFADPAPRTATAPGVLPPPAAPLYSMRPEPAPRVHEVERPVAEQLGAAKEALERAQVSIEGNVRVAAQRASRTTESPVVYDRRRMTPHGATPMRPRHRFDPVAAAQAGMLNLAWSWQAAGSPIRAIHTYMQLLARYPHSAAAAAAVADLVELSGKLAEQGHFHIALSIYEEMEELDQMCDWD